MIFKLSDWLDTLDHILKYSNWIEHRFCAPPPEGCGVDKIRAH